MSAAFQATNRPRFALIGVLMFGVLAVATGVAYLMVVGRRDLEQSGAELVTTLHERGLSAFWERSPRVRWLLVRRSDRIIGWNVSVRMPLPEGGFEGLDVQMIQTDERAGGGGWEAWRLNADATQGMYQAGAMRLTPQGPGWTDANTRIRLSGGKVATDQIIQGRRFLREAPAPDNYAPEGALPLLRRLAVEAGQPAAFRMVLNKMPPQRGRPAFVIATMETEEGEQDEYPEAVARVKQSISQLRQGAKSYLLDETGELVAILGDDARSEPVGPDEVFEAFPEAQQTVEAMSGQLLETVSPPGERTGGLIDWLRTTFQQGEPGARTRPATETSIRAVEETGE